MLGLATEGLVFSNGRCYPDSMTRPNILLSGIKVFPNQFSRGLAALGCEVTHVSNDKLIANPPARCDGAVLCLVHCSHSDTKLVKELYKGMGKPVVLVPRHSFAEAKQDIEKMVMQIRNEKDVPKPPKPLATSLMNAAVIRKTPEKVIETRVVPAPAPVVEQAPVAAPPPAPTEKLVPIQYFVKEMLDRGITDKSQLAAAVTTKGYRKRSGEYYSDKDMHGVIWNARNTDRAKAKRQERKAQANDGMPKAVAEVAPVAGKKVPPEQFREMLMDQVFAANIDDARRVELLKGIRKGTITTLTESTCEVTEDKMKIRLVKKSVLADAPEVDLTLDVTQVQQFFVHAQKLKDFIHGKI